MVRVISVSGLPSHSKPSRSEVADGWFDQPKVKSKEKIDGYFLPVVPTQFIDEGEELDLYDDSFQELDE